MKKSFLSILLSILALCASAEDGSRLWLRMQQNIAPHEVAIKQKGKISPTLAIAKDEIAKHYAGPCAVTLAVEKTSTANDGFTISRQGNALTISSTTDNGVLYGAYALLRMQETGEQLADGQTKTESPTSDLRVLNHWDNLNGTIERGYAGRSLWWSEKEDLITANRDRIIQYARANASVGINATVLNNVNASPKVLTPEYINKVKRIADIIRPYGIRVFLSINFASPKALGFLDTADPLDANVVKWWKAKVAEVYKAIPDFGGFLVKANSEGEPGPQDFGRTHVDGANMLADALLPHKGIVMWRAFVYAANSPDRACQAYDEFQPLDGQFRDNVILQVKNGPVDFQPREPIHPLFFSMKKTKVMPEVQITQEYLGESIHTVFLASMWRELLQRRFTAVAGVSNVGNSVNYCGSDMAQANWYAFGRMAWDCTLTEKQIAREFIAQTFTKDAAAIDHIAYILLRSHEAAVNYMMPLGLHHIFAGGHHYGPEPWCYHAGWREDWLPRYYHKADEQGLGFNRTKTGSAATQQYPADLAALYDDVNTCPEEYLLWFHHVGWNQRLASGETLWNRLCHKYDQGIDMATTFVDEWRQVENQIDPERFAIQLKKFDRQRLDAWWWRDACLLYFQQFSKLPLPDDCPPFRHELDKLMRFNIPMDNYTAAKLEILP